jgi:membrane protein DedA with SNARE-associated domain
LCSSSSCGKSIEFAAYSTVAVAAWGGWLLLMGFAAILVWDEVWDLPNNAALSGYLLLLITGKVLRVKKGRGV